MTTEPDQASADADRKAIRMGLFETMREAATGITSKAAELVGVGVDKLKASLDEMMDGAPHLQQVGYRLTDVELELALPPRAILHLVREFEATAEAFQGALREHATNRTFCTVLKLLQQVNHVNSQVTLKNRRLTELEIDLTLPPCVRLRYAEPAPGASAGAV